MEIAVVLTTLSIGSIVLGVLFLPLVVVRLPEDYFSRPPGENRWFEWSFGRKVRAIVRSVFGLGLVAVGVALLFLPGQGVLMILGGVVLAEFPGKYRLERWLLGRNAVFSALNAIRSRFGKAPFRLEGDSPPADA